MADNRHVRFIDSTDNAGRPLAQCYRCLHKHTGKPSCDAFPRGIPEDIASGEHQHTTKYPGDGGIVFAPMQSAKASPSRDLMQAIAALHTIAATTGATDGSACVLPPDQITQQAEQAKAEKKQVNEAFASGDPAALTALTAKQLQTLAKEKGVALARTKAEFIKLLDAAEPGIYHGDLAGALLQAKLKQYSIGALRTKDELIALLAQKQAEFIQAQVLAQAVNAVPEAATSLEAMTVKQLQEMATKNGVTLSINKAELIAYLDELEPGINHALLSPLQLSEAKKAYKIGPLKNKKQLIAAIEKALGKMAAQQAVESGVAGAAQQAAVQALQKAAEDAAVKVVLPPSPAGYPDFLAALKQAEAAITSADGVDPAILTQLSQQVAMKKQVFQQQLSAMTSSELKDLAKETKLYHYQWATKDDMITIMSETDPAKVAAAKEKIETKWSVWNAKHGKGGIPAGVSPSAAAAAQAALDAQAAAAAAAAQVAEEALQAQKIIAHAQVKNALDDIETFYNMSEPNTYADLQKALQHAKATLQSHGSTLSGDEMAEYLGKVSWYQTSFKEHLSGMKMADLKEIAKAKKIKNWAFATKDDLVTLMGESNQGQIQSVADALETKVAGYKKTPAAPGAPKKKKGAAALHEMGAQDTVPQSMDYTAVDAEWAQVATNPDSHFTFVKDATSLGGVHPKSIYADPQGNEWLFKPLHSASDAFIADADEMTYRLSRILDPNAIEVRKVRVNGQWGTIQRMKKGLKAQKDFDDIDVADISPEEMAQLLKHHVMDWLISNHDCHSANFLRLQDGSVVPIDRAQAFKFFGRDKLDTSYNPNNLPEHPTTLYNAIFQRVQAGRLQVDPRHTLDAIERLEALGDDEYLALLRPYATGRPGDTEAFLQAALERKHNLRSDFEGFYQKALKKPDFKFADLKQADARRASAILPKDVEEAVVVATEREHWMGTVIPVDRDMVEDVQMHMFVERKVGRGGRTEHRTTYKLKMRPEKEKQIMDAIRQAQRGGAKAGEILNEDTYYNRVLEGVRTVNGHLDRGDRNFNLSRLQQALDCEPELRALLNSDRVEVRDMAEHYLKVIDELTVFQRGGTTAAGRVANLDQFKALPGRVTTSRTGGTSFRLTEGKVAVDKRKNVDGHIEVDKEGQKVGSLFSGSLPHDGKQYTLDFDDGTQIKVRPWPEGSYGYDRPYTGQNYYAIAGDIEIVVPGKGTPEQVAEVFEKLKTLGIPAEVAPPEYIEYLYLHQNAVANNLHVDDMAYRQMLTRFEQRNVPIPDRVEEMVQYWNGRLGVQDVRRLPRYNPQGTYQYDTQARSKDNPLGYRRTERFDIDVAQKMKGYNLLHQAIDSPASAYVDLVDLSLTHNGSLLSTTEKMRIGVQVGGLSPESDMGSGGANYVFTRWRPDARGPKSKNEMGFYLKPQVAQRTDTIVYQTDHYGRCHGNFVNEHRETNPTKWKRIAETYSNNETIVKHNITLLDNLDYVVLDSEQAKKDMVKVFKKHGIEKLPDGRKVEDIIHVIPYAARGYMSW